MNIMYFKKRFFALLTLAAVLFTGIPAATTHAETLSLSQQISGAAEGALIVLQGDIQEDVLVDKNISLDLNGFDIAGTVQVAEGCTLTVSDSQTDDYTVDDTSGYGIITAFEGNVTADSHYMMITEDVGHSFHRLDMEITSMTLRPECAGVYYNGSLYGDTLVAANVKQFGIALRIRTAPDATYMQTHSAYSLYKGFNDGPGGNEAAGTLLKNVMNPSNTVEINADQSQAGIYSCVYVKTLDGQYIFSESVSRSFMAQMRAADALWPTLTAAQKASIRAMYNTYSSIMENWYLPNLHNTDIDIPI